MGEAPAATEPDAVANVPRTPDPRGGSARPVLIAVGVIAVIIVVGLVVVLLATERPDHVPGRQPRGRLPGTAHRLRGERPRDRVLVLLERRPVGDAHRWIPSGRVRVQLAAAAGPAGRPRGRGRHRRSCGDQPADRAIRPGRLRRAAAPHGTATSGWCRNPTAGAWTNRSSASSPPRTTARKGGGPPWVPPVVLYLYVVAIASLAVAAAGVYNLLAVLFGEVADRIGATILADDRGRDPRADQPRDRAGRRRSAHLADPLDARRAWTPRHGRARRGGPRARASARSTCSWCRS